MTSTEMTTLLGLRLEDPSEVNFTSATKINALNVGQRTLVNLIHESYLTELENLTTVVPSSTDKSNGYIVLGSGVNPLRNRIMATEVKYDGDFKFVAMVPFYDAKDIENSYLTPDEGSPVAWVVNNKLHIRPSATLTGIKVYYLGLPSAIASDANSPLNAGLHDIIVDLAEAELWKMDNNVSRSQLAREMGIQQIQVLNERYGAEAPKEVQ